MKAPAKRRARAAKRPAKQEVDRFELAMRAINEGVYEWNIADGSTVYSDRVLRSLGLSRRQLRNAADWHQRIHPEDRARFDAALRDHFKGRTERFECDLRYRAGDGGWRWARQHGVAIRDAKGRAVRMIGSTGDITELKRVEEALKASEERYALATRAATEGIYEWNLESDSLYLSDRAKAFFAVAGEALTPAAWNARVHGEDFQGYRDAIVAFFKGRKPVFEHEYRIRDAAGGYAWVRDRAIAVRDPAGRVTRFVGALTDITQRRRAELELRRAHESTTEALARQTATAEILKAIAASPTDVRPVLEALARHAGELCGAAYVNVLLEEESMLRTMAVYSAAGGPPADTAFAMRPLPTTVNGRAFVERRPVHVPDFMAVAATEYPDSLEFQRHFGFRTILGVPMLRAGQAIGTISIWRREVRPFSAEEIALIETFAAQAVIAIENVRLFNETREALERQTATAEILKVIASSPADVQPVFEAIVTAALKLCAATSANAVTFDGELIHVAAVAEAGASAADALGRHFGTYPKRPSRDTANTRAILTRQVVAIPDVMEDADYAAKATAVAAGYRSIVSVPLMRGLNPIGALTVARPEPGHFPEGKLALLQTFADQAVIAIENARLFNETREALERQTATSELLKVIGQSTSVLQPVFDTLAQNAVKVCHAAQAFIFRFDGQFLRVVATCNVSPELRRFFADNPVAPGRATVAGRAAAEGRTIHVHDVRADPEYRWTAHRVDPIRTVLTVPILRGRDVVGVIGVNRPDVRPFGEHEIALLESFASQALIAIENVRLFNETNEALERQTAISDILRVISGSPADVKPVLDTVATHAARICHAQTVDIALAERNSLRIVASVGDEGRVLGQELPLDRSTVSGRSIVDRAPVHVADMQEAGSEFPLGSELAHKFGIHTILGVPLLREGRALGAILVRRAEVRPLEDKHVALLKTFADQAAIAIENARLFNETKEALELQTATSEVLRVISGTPADPQPVFDAIAQSAARVFDAPHTAVSLVDGGLLRLKATAGRDDPRRPTFIPFDRTSTSGCALLDKVIVDVPDTEAAGAPLFAQDASRAMAFRAIASAPMLREGAAIGAITVARAQPGALSDKRRQLLQTFADQAVIAIENARLFNETKEAFERQKASAEILGTISSSIADTEPVFEKILESCERLFAGRTVGINVLGEDQMIHLGAYRGPGRGAFEKVFPLPIDANSGSGLAIAERRVVHIPDSEADGVPEAARRGNRARGNRASLYAPMISRDKAIGVIWVARELPGAFSETEIALLKTFADQAVIAIDNARLFNETREALEQQTASSQILGVISSSLTDLRPVFDAILESATRLCDAHLGVLNLFEGEMCRTLAQRGASPEFAKWVLERGAFKPAAAMARVLVERKPFHVPDAREGPGFKAGNENAMKFVELGGVRTYLAVPLLKEGAVIGSINIFRPDVRPFTDTQFALVSTFANQAVIAIENARLFNETKEALEQQTATAEILKVISGSPTDEQPVFDAIVSTASRLFGRRSRIRVVDADRLQLRASSDRLGVQELGEDPLPVTRQTLGGRVALDRAAAQVADTQAADAPLDMGMWGRKSGYRAIAGAPLMRGETVLGVLSVTSTEPGALSEKEMSLLTTFANQAAIAIENARLFNETREALERQTATAEILRVISGSPTATQPVFESIVQKCHALYQDSRVALLLIDEGRLNTRASTGYAFEPIPIDRESGIGACVLEGRTIHLPDLEAAAEQYPRLRQLGIKHGYRSGMYAPLMREGRAIGGISVLRRVAGAFSEKDVALLTTFADQAVIAIENVRLFNETKEALEQQTAISEVLRVISSSPADIKPVLEVVASRAAHICDATDARIFVVEGDFMRHASGFGDVPVRTDLVPITRASTSGRAVIDRAPVHVPDIEAESPDEFDHQIARRSGWRSALAVPLMRETRALGAIVLRRREVRPFTEKQAALLATFADQAAIAIENVRLFNETKEALERQTATGEILKVMSASLTDVQPVFDAVALNAARVCGVDDVAILQTEGVNLRRVSHYGNVPVSPHSLVPVPPGSVNERVLSEHRTLHIPDTLAPSFTREFPGSQFPAMGVRALLATPLVRDGIAVGVIHLRRSEARPFTDKQIAMLETFADQAVIAIENVRLFNEIKDSLEQQKASAEVLAAISSSIADTQPVFEKILRSCERLFAGKLVGINLVDPDGLIRLGAYQGPGREELEKLQPFAPGEGSGSGAAILHRRLIQYPDAQNGEDTPPATRRGCAAIGVKSVVFAPMIWEERAIGVIFVGRDFAGEFSEKEIALLRTFADQAVIGIQNARLFREIGEKSRQLEEASRHKSQFLASMSHELRTPLNAILGFNEMILGQIYGEVPPDMKEPLEDIQKSGKHLLRLINNVLDLAKIEAGKMELALADYSVQDTVESVRSTLRPLAEAKGLELVVSVPEDIPLAYGDGGRLTQCLMNLAGNSLKFTKEGRVEIAVEAENGHLRYRVSDTGIGIPPDKIPALFSEFKQTDATIASEYGGTGLGLSITKKFVEMHGGRIWVESEQGKGSVFTLEVPLRTMAPA